MEFRFTLGCLAFRALEGDSWYGNPVRFSRLVGCGTDLTAPETHACGREVAASKKLLGWGSRMPLPTGRHTWISANKDLSPGRLRVFLQDPFSLLLYIP